MMKYLFKLSFIFCLSVQAGVAFSQTSDQIYNINWLERLKPNLGLIEYDSTILGDKLDLESGRLSFEQVDISLSGNSSLPVEIRRKVNPSQWMGHEFSDWYLDVPRIGTIINHYEFSRGTRWGKNRCTKPLVDSIPISYSPRAIDPGAQPLTPEKYNNGVILEVPGRISSAVFDKDASSVVWPAAAKKVAKDNWYLTCITNIDGQGTEGFYAFAPNGDRFKFDIIKTKTVSSSDMWHVEHSSANFTVFGHKERVYSDMLYASEVKDINGNWVKYQYDENQRLRRIISNDGRVIGINYPGASQRISEVIAHPNTPDEKRWEYYYAQKGSQEWQVPQVAFQSPVKGAVTYSVLSKVTLPDELFWTFDLAGLHAKAVPGVGYYNRRSGDLWASDIYSECRQEPQKVTVTHPYGTKGEFYLEERNYFNPLSVTGPSGAPCPKTDEGNQANPYVDIMSMVKKVISSPTVDTAEWRYEYSNAPDTSGNMRTTEYRPDDSKKIYHHGTPSTLLKLKKEELFANKQTTTALETKEYEYSLEELGGSSYLKAGLGGIGRDTLFNILTVKIDHNRDNTLYRTVNAYDSSHTSTNYSYGKPLTVEQSTSASTDKRITKYTYTHNRNNWIVGLINTVHINGKLHDDYDYDEKGRLGIHKRFNREVAKVCYYTDGNIKWVKDGLNRQTTYSSYYRGTPRLIQRADGSEYNYEIGSDGKVTKEIDWNGVETNYNYNESGFLTYIDAPSPFQDTDITYHHGVEGFIQTITRGIYSKTNIYDSFLRVVQSSEGNNSNSKRYQLTSYDAMGRAEFKSFPTSSPWTSTGGVRTQYDALGRVKIIENTNTSAKKEYEYLSDNQVLERDELNNLTSTSYIAFGNPDATKVLKVQKPNSVVTEFTYDSAYNNVKTMRQKKSDGSYLTTTLEYDTSNRLCRLHMPEKGNVLYQYNNADELIGYADGQPVGTGCATIPTDSKISLGYDVVGRLKTTNYPDSITPDIDREYDIAGNLQKITRGNTTWEYRYNDIGLITEEHLSIDGRAFSILNSYDSMGNLNTKTYPSGKIYNFTYNEHQQPTSISYGNNQYISDIQYHVNGKVNVIERGIAGHLVQELDNNQRVSYIGDSVGPSLNYTYNLKSQVQAVTSPGYTFFNRNFTYDGNGRLASATGPWGNATYSYDTLGNITKKAEGTRVVDLQYNAATNRISNVKDTAAGNAWRSYSHDTSGNVTADGRHTFVYDMANQPISIAGETSGTFVYDGNKKRVKQLVDGETIYSFYSQAGPLVGTYNLTTNEYTDYIAAAGQTLVRVKNGVVTYPINDLLGTAIATVSATGTLLNDSIYNYTPWGEIHDSVPFAASGRRPAQQNLQGFTGHIEDKSGLVYMQARYYDPVIGRFLSTDPVDYADQLNLYAYVGNDPVNKIDPTGMYADLAIEAVSIGAGIVSFSDNISDGNYGAAAVDGLGIVADAVLAAVPAIPGTVGIGIQASRGAESAVNAVKLEKQLASEAQVGQLAEGGGTIISQPAKQADRIGAKTGADPANIQKVSSDAHTAKDGQQVQTHSFRDASTNELIEPKTIIDDRQ